MLSVYTPIVPPGINNSYGLNTRVKPPKMYLTKPAKTWKADFTNLTLNAKNYSDWSFDKTKDYVFSILWWGTKHDNDAHTKLVQDAFCKGAGFDDKHIKTTVSYRVSKNEIPKVIKQFPDIDIDERSGVLVTIDELGDRNEST
jgi:hypothetical protein